jgi:hypothetical protein
MSSPEPSEESFASSLSFSLLQLSSSSSLDPFTVLQRKFRAKRQIRLLRAVRLIQDRVRLFLYQEESRRARINMSANQTVIINGVIVKIASTKKQISNDNTALYPKKTRETMSAEKLNDLFERAAGKSQNKYDVMDLKIDDPDKLEDTYDLEMSISRTRAHHIKYDMHDVFTIVKPNADPTKFEQVDLYDNYAMVTEEEVAASNEWYATMTDDQEQNKWFLQNLKLTHEHLSNNSEDNLVAKVNETYFAYPIERRGGPLFFKIMMDILQNNSEDSAEFLVSKVKGLKITDFDGENVEKVVSLVRGAVKRLENLKTKTGKNALPLDLAEQLIKVFKTSSVPSFNALFEHFSMQNQLSEFQGGKATPPTINQVLRFAEVQYRKLCATNEWTGVATKANATTFLANLAQNKGETICFNCGGKHALKECPKPQNEERVKVNKKTFWDKKNKDREAKKSNNKKGNSEKKAKSTKWAPPTETEKKNKNRRIIDDKEYYYHFKDKRWKPVTPPAAAPAANTATPAPAVIPNVADVAPPANNQAKEVAIANATRQIETCFRGLLNQF